MQKALIIFALLAISTLAMRVNSDEIRSLWSAWKIYYGKAYTLVEEAARFAIFVENFVMIQKFNSESTDVQLALNKFADLTPDEFTTIHAGCYKDNGKNVKVIDNVDYSVIELPTSVDWRTQGAVTAVKNQGQCGSCWAFSTTGTLESLYYIKKNKLLSFSEQQLVDCDTNDAGCDGGLPYQALEYTANNGLETEDAYPYTAIDGTCNAKKLKTYNTNSNYQLIATQNSDALKTAVVNQPVSVAIQADQRVFQFYTSGVILKNCGDSLNHAVLAVGYTTLDGDEAFIVKNSWGSDWGVQGYVYISTNGSPNGGNGVCGILGQPVVPVW